MTSQRIALITGGNRGLGRATALALAERGVDVVVTYRSGKDQAEEVVESVTRLGRTVAALPLDTAVVAGFDDFTAELRRTLRERWHRDDFDHLVNNAGIAVTAAFADTTESDFDALVDVHFKGVFFLTQRLLPLIADGGRIVNLSTGLTRFASVGQAAYGSVKGAVEVLTRYLAKELGPRGIAVNTVAPGPVATDFAGGIMRDDEGFRAMLASQTALGRVGEPADVGGAISALLTDGSGWITGQRVEVSGGIFL
ncbi:MULTISPECIES: SDR family NAD(P)-dependent oxidoreductase [Microbispora]|uniref:SDR family NAD(P)-dependent oxidoreductase n=1 Tax=Microbispora TaxID=2005 RepID=UPI0011CCCB71|nr:SDR family oxidoreductase [Microbispora sp. CSR-4]